MVVRKKNSLERGLSSSDVSQKILQDLQKYGLSKTELQQILSSPEEEAVPAGIFISSLTVLESTVKYLREEKGYSLHNIAEILGRDEKNIWHSYHNAQKKMPSRFWVKDSDILVPLKVFSESKNAPLGAIVFYLKEQKQLSFHNIARILERDDRTIWTTYTRAKKEHSLEITRSEDISEKILQDLQKYGLSKTELQQILSSPEEEAVPAHIFISSLTVLESTVKYLREEKGYSLHNIAEILGRDEKNIWHAYHNAQKKMPSRFWVKDSDILVPLKIFSESEKAPLGAIVLYLKEQMQLSFHSIARILERNDRTIWTTYTRAKKEHEKK